MPKKTNNQKDLVVGAVAALFILLSGLIIGRVSEQIENAKSNKQVLSKTVKASKPTCATIQNGNLHASDGSVISTGFDQWGYNYQALLFNGGYCDAYRNAAWCQPYKNDQLAMKWNDAWLSNQDCDGDGLLDRHYGTAAYKGSGAWLTNHMSGEYEQGGVTQKWNNFVKIVAVPADAVLQSGVWSDANGNVIGPEIWGEFAIIQSILNDSGTGAHGNEKISPVGPGFGKFK